MARNSGTLLRVYLGGDPIGYATQGTFEASTNMTSILHKDSAGGGFEEVDPSTQSATLSCEGYHSYDTTINSVDVNGVEELRAAWLNKTALTFKWSTAVSATQYITGTCYIENLQENTSAGETATYSVSFKVSGAVTLADEA